MNRGQEERLGDLDDLAGIGELGRTLDDQLVAGKGRHPVADGRRGRNQVEVILALEPLLNDLHVEEPEKAAAKSKP